MFKSKVKLVKTMFEDSSLDLSVDDLHGSTCNFRIEVFEIT